MPTSFKTTHSSDAAVRRACEFPAKGSMVGRKVAELFKRKDVEISVQRYLIDAMGAMA